MEGRTLNVACLGVRLTRGEFVSLMGFRITVEKMLDLVLAKLTEV